MMHGQRNIKTREDDGLHEDIIPTFSRASKVNQAK